MFRNGIIILAIFAALWGEVALSFAGPLPAVARLAPVVVSLALIAAAVRASAGATDRGRAELAGEDSARRGRVIGWASALEGVAIFVAVNVLVWTGHRDATVPVIAIIVGLHFVPLAWGLPEPLYYATGAALVAVGLLGFVLGTPDARGVAVGAGSALALWLSGAARLVMATARSVAPRPTPLVR